MKHEDPIEALGRFVASRQDVVLEGYEGDESMRQRVAHHAASARRHDREARTRLPWVLAAAAIAVLLGVILLRRARTEPVPLAFTVGSPPVPGVAGELAVASNKGPLPVRFSEGTTVRLEPDARARFVGLGPRGAEVILEAGRAHVEVVPRPHGDWSIRAGPFAVRVKGTKFDVEYDPRNDGFSLSLFEGSVVVSGCGFDGGRRVEAGETVKSSCARHEPVVLGEPPIPRSSARDTPASPPARSIGADAPSGARAAPAPESAHERRAAETWLGLARQGFYPEAYELARDAFDDECRTRPAAEALLLGDTARLSGHSAEARQAYAAVRNRFPASPEAAQAAFALGRLALHANGDRAGAEQWFATSLRERANGPLAAAALGRLLELRSERGDHEGATSAAREYLERFPGGPHAADARKLLGVSAGNGERRPE